MTTEFKWHETGGCTDECDACGSEVPTALFDMRDPRRRGEHKRLCEICANSQVGCLVDYPREDATILKAMAQIANQVLLKLGAFSGTELDQSDG